MSLSAYRKLSFVNLQSQQLNAMRLPTLLLLTNSWPKKISRHAQNMLLQHLRTVNSLLNRLYREKQEDNVHSKAMRIRNFVNYSNSENYTYSIKQLPPINAWGVKKHNKDWSHYICHPRIGLISKVWFFAPGPNGAPHPQVPYKNLRKVQKPMIGVILTSWPGTIKLLFTDKEIIKQLSPSQPATMLVTRSLKNATWRPIPLTV
ncbi:hypothetical protein SERLA73DRAFT_148982 [Serpula lacrymans var. lacrymans S7.3]|uniref:Uncharacterized protein n=1 Tax=Serpula lacrymans var. lacrymans (strain S7.3) TaxID=936435 RepID=F8PHG7_SERL3|nr:hypothetical protein SERLA73DRAFT_148982 [Serpula lacrymans var. lacrymans S7.3]